MNLAIAPTLLLLVLLGSDGVAALRCGTPGVAQPTRASAASEPSPASLRASERLVAMQRPNAGAAAAAAAPLPTGFATAASGALALLTMVEPAAAASDVAWVAPTKFFLGTDSAPHELLSKHTACGCAGVFSAHAALELYATVFERAGALDKLEAFAAFNGPDFYGLPRNTTRVTLERTTWTTPKDYPFKGGRLVPILAGEDLAWKLRDDDAVPVPGSFCARCPPPRDQLGPQQSS